MKKYIKLFLIIGCFYLLGCKEDEKNRFPATTTGILPTITVIPGKDVFDVNNRANAEVAFELGVNNFGGNLRADSITVKIARQTSLTASEASPTAATTRVYTTVKTFPSTVTLRLAEIARILGIADINTIAADNSIDVILELRTTNGILYSPTVNSNPSVNTTYQLGTFRRRFYVGCPSAIATGAYTATARVRVGTGPEVVKENQVRINRQVITVDQRIWLNFLPNMYTITDLSGGFYENNTRFPNTARNQPVGIRQGCNNTFILYNDALLTLPSPEPQRTALEIIPGGSWNGSTNTLVLNWRDGAAGGANTVTGVTTFVRTGN